MTNEYDDYEESFVARNRRTLAVVAVIAAVGLTVIGYNLTRPKPSGSVGDTTSGPVAQGGTLAVGALPVT